MVPKASTSGVGLQQESSVTNHSEFVQFKASMRLPIAPVFAANGSAGGLAGSGGMDGVREVLAGWLMRYIPPLRLVLLTFEPIPTFDHPSADFPAHLSPFPEYTKMKDPSTLLRSPSPNDKVEENDEMNGTRRFKSLPMIEGSGYTLAVVKFQGLGWRPRIGQRMFGSPTLSTPSHVSLLLHDLFNASIPVSHIPLDTYHYNPDYPVPESIQQRQRLSYRLSAEKVAATQTAAEVMVEGAQFPEAEASERVAAIEQEKLHEEEEEEHYRERGWWIHNVTKEPLGGANGLIEFTVVGLTVANSMISVNGSLLANPFEVGVRKEKAVPAVIQSRKRRREDSESSSSSSRSPSPAPLKAPPRVIFSAGPEDVKPKIEDLYPRSGRLGKNVKKEGTEEVEEDDVRRRKLEKKEKKRAKKEKKGEKYKIKKEDRHATKNAQKIKSEPY